MMPTDAEKATRAHEKKIVAKKAEAEKQARLAERRATICNAAHNVLPRFDKPDLPDTPLLRPVSSLSTSARTTSKTSTSSAAMYVAEDEKTYETPFKGAKRTNPLNEKKLQIKAEEHRRIAEISAEQNINKSQAKLLIAQNPMLQRPSSPRSISSDSSRSYLPPLSSPLASSFTERDGYITHVPLTSIPNDASFKAQKMMGIPQSATVQRSKSERAMLQHPGSPQRSQSHRSLNDDGEDQLVSKATRLTLQRNKASTMSVDTTLVRPRNQLQRCDTNATYLSTYSVAPSIATVGGESAYTASVYSPVVHFQESDAPIERITPGHGGGGNGNGYSTPRMLATVPSFVPIPTTAPLVPKPRKASIILEEGGMNESRLFDMSQRI